MTGAAQPGVGLLATGMVQRSLGMRVLYIYIYIHIHTSIRCKRHWRWETEAPHERKQRLEMLKDLEKAGTSSS